MASHVTITCNSLQGWITSSLEDKTRGLSCQSGYVLNFYRYSDQAHTIRIRTLEVHPRFNLAALLFAFCCDRISQVVTILRIELRTPEKEGNSSLQFYKVQWDLQVNVYRIWILCFTRGSVYR
ncbi:hypothetical protein WN944_005754 [Citrus x changshan-huyou]|uniref:Uncharacterized protein n=1 Tax=Citrus x changshan-huyou TaxID=2935761 RepID=A0AAP0MHY7_9ROSI